VVAMSDGRPAAYHMIVFIRGWSVAVARNFTPRTQTIDAENEKIGWSLGRGRRAAADAARGGYTGTP